MKFAQGIALALVAVLAVGVGAYGDDAMSAINGNNPADSITNPGGNNDGDTSNSGLLQPSESGTLSVAAYDETAQSRTQVAVSNGFIWNTAFDTLYQETLSASDRTSVSDFNGQDGYKAIAFDSSFPYAVAEEGSVTKKNTPQNLKVFEGVSGANLDTRTYYDGDSVSSISLGQDEQKTLDNIYARVNAPEKSFNPRLVVFDTSDNTNVSDITMPGATAVKVPEPLKDSGYDEAFKVSFNVGGETVMAGEGQPILMGYESGETDSVVEIKANADGTSGESLTYGFVDYAPFINQNDELAHGVVDDSSSPADVGLSVMTGTLTLN